MKNIEIPDLDSETPSERRILAYAKGSPERYRCHYTRNGAVWAATDGSSFVMLATDREDALIGLQESEAHGTAALSDVITCLRPILLSKPVESADISLPIEIDEISRLACIAEQTAMHESASVELARLTTLSASASTRARVTIRGEIRRCRDQQKAAERAISKQDHLEMHAARFGEAWFDARLLTRCMRALGSNSGTINTGKSALDPAVIVTSTGIAIVMPAGKG